MARIRVLEAIAGDDFSWSPGDVVELTEKQAEAWADGHRAERADASEDGPVPDHVQQQPRVVTADGLELEVLTAEMEELPPTAGVDDGTRWFRWSVTVALPVAAGVQPTPGGGEEPRPAEVEVFDPTEHKVTEVLGYLATASEEEALRVLDAEAAAPKPRAGIVNAREDTLAAARERAARDHESSEKAVDTSRGGGRGDVPETR
ncbi:MULTISPECIES: hypothetical protein [unclassified Streptomyces]|uniref:hypothetical protein n=1 Tax=unclassified Streptomyces TaxID=2593676 RepID=UPI0036DFF0F7